MIDQPTPDPAKTPAQDLPDESLEQATGGRGSPKPLNPQPLPPISC